MRIWLFPLIVYLLTHSVKVFGQSVKIDSIKNLVNLTEDDSLKAEYYYRLGRYLRNEKIEESLEYSLKSIESAKKADTKYLLAACYNQAGISYYSIGDYQKTLDYFYEVLAIYEQIDDSLQIAKVYNNVGLILLDLGRIEETIDYYEKSFSIRYDYKDSAGMASIYTNLGLVYYHQKKLDTAQNYFFNALAIDTILNVATDILKDYSNIADVYVLRNKYDSANFFYNKAIDIMDQAEEKYSKVELLEKMARLNQKEKKYPLAIEKYELALAMAEDIQAKLLIRNNYLGLSEVYKELGDYKKSLDSYEKYVSIQTELFNQEQAEKLSQIETNYQITQRENKINLLNKESEIKDLRLSNSEMVIYWLAGIMALVLLIIILQVRKNNFKTRANNLLRSQNEEIVEKNKNIMDSILCARNIQQAILPEDEKLNEIFDEAFVYSKGRDVVSGDFYWFAEKNNKIFIAAVDCTGHGVPAAFLNVLGNSLLNQIVNEQDITSPSQVLSELNRRVLKSLQSNKLSVQVDDGMDIGLCVVDKSTKELSFAGAKRPLYYYHDNQLQIIKGDHHAVGGELYGFEREYTDHTLTLTEGDIIYLFTDGIVDQFGGESNKKFMYSRLKELFESVIREPLSEQKSKIEEAIAEWQGSNDQTDDMLLIGVKI